MFPTTFSLSGVTTTLRLLPGNCCSRIAVIAFTSTRARASVTPSRRRAKMRRLWPSRDGSRGASASGAHNSDFVAQKGANWNVGGMTPTTV